MLRDCLHLFIAIRTCSTPLIFACVHTADNRNYDVVPSEEEVHFSINQPVDGLNWIGF